MAPQGQLAIFVRASRSLLALIQIYLLLWIILQGDLERRRASVCELLTAMVCQGAVAGLLRLSWQLVGTLLQVVGENFRRQRLAHSGGSALACSRSGRRALC